jgi:phage terminase small subunit
MHNPLTFRQERFVFEYLKDQNASAAAARAGYMAKNLASQGSELMGNPAIADRIRVEMQSILAELRCSALELMKQRMRAAFFDPGKLLNGWEPVPLEELDAETRAVLDISTVMRKSGPVVRVKQADRHKALRALERVHEQMEKLNERYYAKLEREGKLMSLEEIEAMDGGGGHANADAGAESPVEKISEKDQVFSGSAFHAVEPGAVGPVLDFGERGARPSTGSGRTGGGGEILEKAQVFSGLGSPGRDAFSENGQVFSGWTRGADADGLRNSEKDQVFSGWPLMQQRAGRAAAGGVGAAAPAAGVTA